MCGSVDYQLSKQNSPLTDDDVIQRLANAAATHGGVGGHGKAENNRQNMEGWKAELIKRGVVCPPIQKLYDIGVFNGEGSY